KLGALKTIENADGKKTIAFHHELFRLNKKKPSKNLDKVLNLFWLFPALVLPVEIREDSSVVAESLSSPINFPIGRMLASLKSISQGHDPKCYVRGFILSMCESDKDVHNGMQMIQKTMGSSILPIVPLFETEH